MKATLISTAITIYIAGIISGASVALVIGYIAGSLSR